MARQSKFMRAIGNAFRRNRKASADSAEHASEDQATQTFQFKLISVQSGTSPLYSAELEKAVQERGKKKPLVLISLKKDHMQVCYKKPSKNEPKDIACYPFTNIYGVLQNSSEPRAVGFCIKNRNEKEIKTFILIAKKQSWIRRKRITEAVNFAECLRNVFIKSNPLIYPVHNTTTGEMPSTNDMALASTPQGVSPSVTTTMSPTIREIVPKVTDSVSMTMLPEVDASPHTSGVSTVSTLSLSDTLDTISLFTNVSSLPDSDMQSQVLDMTWTPCTSISETVDTIYNLPDDQPKVVETTPPMSDDISHVSPTRDNQLSSPTSIYAIAAEEPHSDQSNTDRTGQVTSGSQFVTFVAQLDMHSGCDNDSKSTDISLVPQQQYNNEALHQPQMLNDTSNFQQQMNDQYGGQPASIDFPSIDQLQSEQEFPVVLSDDQEQSEQQFSAVLANLLSEDSYHQQQEREQHHWGFPAAVDDAEDSAAYRQQTEHYLGSLYAVLDDADFPCESSVAQDALVPSEHPTTCQQQAHLHSEEQFSVVTDSSLPYWIPPTADSNEQQGQQCLKGNLSQALDSAFASSSYNAPSLYETIQTNDPCDYEFSDEVFQQESFLLQYTSMLVPLFSSEAASFSQTETLKYIPFHVTDPTLDDIPVPRDYQLPSPQLADLNDDSIPEHVRKGISYDQIIVDFKPEFDMTYQDYNDQNWFSNTEKPVIVVGRTPSNGLQHLPSVPTKSFIHRMEKLLDAYLKPKMYHERNLGVSNNPEKIARYLATSDYPEEEGSKIFSYRDPRLCDYWFYAPCCAREPELQLVLD